MDSISLSKRGANVTGVDFSNKAIEKAKELANILSTDTKFIEADIYNLPNIHNEKYDIVFASYGVIGWHPNVKRWLEVASGFLRPEGKLLFVEFHPLIWTMDENMQEFIYRYFNTEPIIESGSGSYTENSNDLEITEVGWNHGLAEIVQATIDNGLSIERLQEYDYTPYNCFKNMIEIEDKVYRHEKHSDKIPYIFSLVATNNQ